MLTAETASEYDFVIALDASGSMASPSTRYDGKSRWEEAQETIYGIAHALHKFDSDGIDVVVFGANVETFEAVTPEKVADLFKSRSPRGSTPLHLALASVQDLASDGKKTVCIVFTDGEPDSRPDVVAQISSMADKLASDDEMTILMVQIGNDTAAAKFLMELDDNLNTKFDIVDTISAADADKMEPIDLINKAIAD